MRRTKKATASRLLFVGMFLLIALLISGFFYVRQTMVQVPTVAEISQAPLFFDGFDGPIRSAVWTTKGAVKQSPGYADIYGSGSWHLNQLLSVQKFPSDSLILETKVKVSNGNGYALALGYGDTSWYRVSSGAAVFIGFANTGKFKVWRYQNSQEQVATELPVSYVAGRWYKIKMVLRGVGAGFSVYQDLDGDGQFIGDAENTDLLAGLRNSGVSLSGLTNKSILFESYTSGNVLTIDYVTANRTLVDSTPYPTSSPILASPRPTSTATPTPIASPTPVPSPIACQYGVASLNLNTSCGDQGFRYATYQCNNRSSGQIGNGSTCYSVTEIMQKAVTDCNARCL